MNEPTGNRIVPGGLRPVAILGVTASGKSSLAMEVARRRGDVELVSVDSMQVYRGMDIGTAKPTPAERAEVRHHVLDLVDPWERFDVARFRDAVTAALADISARRRRAILVGGTGLYLRAIVDDLDLPGRFPDVAAQLESEPDTAALHARLMELDAPAATRIEPGNRRRIVRALEVTIGSGQPFSSFGPGLDTFPPTPVELIGIRRDRADMTHRITERFEAQMRHGLLEEVRSLRAGPLPSRTAAQALGYRELMEHLDAVADGSGSPTLDDAVGTAIRRIRRFAVRQERWFRRDPRIVWLEPADAVDRVLDIVAERWDR